MGSQVNKSRTETRDQYSPTNGLLFGNVYITDELLARILCFVSDVQVVRTCRLVCQNWRALIDTNEVWIYKCRLRRRPLPNSLLRALQPLPTNLYRDVVFFDPYSDRNLVRNPYGEEGNAFWTIEHSGGDGWRVECPPVYADAVDGECNSCFATSYHRCAKYQIIRFADLNILQTALDVVRPAIEFREYFAHRTDCSSRYSVTVTLYGERGLVVDEFRYAHDEMQWAGGQWHKVEHVFRDYPPGVMAVKVAHFGHDLQFWAGHYGPKITGSAIFLKWNH